LGTLLCNQDQFNNTVVEIKIMMLSDVLKDASGQYILSFYDTLNTNTKSWNKAGPHFMPSALPYFSTTL